MSNTIEALREKIGALVVLGDDLDTKIQFIGHRLAASVTDEKVVLALTTEVEEVRHQLTSLRTAITCMLDDIDRLDPQPVTSKHKAGA